MLIVSQLTAAITLVLSVGEVLVVVVVENYKILNHHTFLSRYF
jgi:hypothetical protein